MKATYYYKVLDGIVTKFAVFLYNIVDDMPKGIEINRKEDSCGKNN